MAVAILCELIRAHNLLFETLVTSSRVEEIRARINFDGFYAVDCVDRNGVVCVL